MKRAEIEHTHEPACRALAKHGLRLLAVGFVGCLAACGPGRAQGAAPSYSRLSAHLIINYTAGARQIVAAHPRVLKILDVGGNMLAAAREFKSGTPDGKLVLRIYTPRRYSITDDPAACAQDFWNTVLAPPINGLSASDRALIDYVEGPNEGDSTPTWATIQEAQWYNTFWVTLAPLIGNAGFRPCAFSIAVGNPPGTAAYVRQVLDTIVPALRACKSYGGGWSYHAYTIPYSTDITQEIWYSLRYRQYYDYFRQQYPDLSNLPLIMTEGGVDGQTAPGGPGWRMDTATRYQNWLTWFDQQISQDPYVIGCTLFQSGDTGDWFSFDLEPVAAWLANHLATASPPGPPSTPADLVAVAAGPAAVQMKWTASVDVSSYKVKRATVGGGPYTTVATPTASSYTDTGLATGTRYYYVVSAVNAHSESGNSNQATAVPVRGYAVNCGGDMAAPYASDAHASGGSTYATTATIDTSGVTDPAPQAVYRSERWATSTLTYTFPDLPAGTPYNVRLHFAEIYFGNAGERKFHVKINGTQVLTDFDIVAAAGGANKAVTRTFLCTANASDQVVVQFNAGSANNPKISGIEVTSALPATPTSFVATAGDGRVTLSWNAAAGATGYNVKRATANGGPYGTVAGNVTATTWTDTGVTNGTAYYYVVSAVNAAGESPNSAQASATPLPPAPPAPTGLTATPGSGKVTLAWNAAAGAANYNVKRSVTSGGPYAIIAGGVASTSYTNTGLTNGVTYYYVVSATNLGGEGPNSSQAGARPTAPSIPGDFDGDGDVDLSDFSFLQMCFNGPNRPPLFPLECAVADADADNDVDLADFTLVQACFNGPNRAASCQ